MSFVEFEIRTYRKAPVSVGDVFGRWKVRRIGLPDNQVRCRCRCGTVRDVYASNLRDRSSQSCGCAERSLP